MAGIGRREVLRVLGGAGVAWPVGERAQQPDRRMPRIGVIEPLAASDPEGQTRVQALRQGLHEVGWMVGNNVQINYRWAPGETVRARRRGVGEPETGLNRGRQYACDDGFASRNAHNSNSIRASRRSIGPGFVSSFARPGGNTTGITNFEFTMLLTLTVSSAARNRRSFPSKRPTSSSWSSISKLPRRLASTCPCGFSNSPTRSKNE
jgi:putative tryptophan/tyrosine transport system substrate-binding protein